MTRTRYTSKREAKGLPGSAAFVSTKMAQTDCIHCGKPAHEHEKERVYPDDGPAGSYHYELYCP